MKPKGPQPRTDRYKSRYRSAIRSTVKRSDTAARHTARSISPTRLIAFTASSTLLTRKPVTPSSISSGIDPRLQAITGVPQASASTTDSPNGSSKLIRWSSARGTQGVGAGRAAHRAAMDHGALVQRGHDLLVIILLILDDTGHDQPPTRSTCRRNRLGRPLVRVDAAEEEQVFAAVRVEGKVLQPNTVVDCCCIAQVRMAIGIADRDIMDAILVCLEGGQDAFRGEAVDRRHHRRLHQPGECERHEIGLVVNEVELTDALEYMGDVEHLPYLGVDSGVLGIGRWADAGQSARRPAILRGEQGDVDAARHQRFGQQARHQLPWTIMARRRAPGDRSEHGD